MKKIWLVALATFIPLTAHADDVVPSISVTGFAEGKIQPDKATVSVQVYTEHKELATAKASQDKKVKQLLSVANSHEVPSKDIRTRRANVQPQYDYVRDGKNRNKRVFRAYVLTNSIDITLRDLDKVGPVVDQLVAKGFDRINNVQFGLENRRQHEEAMLTEALTHARQKAGRMAAALGVRVGKPLTVSESGSYSPPVLRRSKAMAMSAMADSASESIPSYTPEGEVSIQKTVNVTFELK